MIGPADPAAIGGAAVLFQQLVKAVESEPGLRVCVLDSSRRPGRRGAICWAVRALLTLCRRAGQFDVLSFHASAKRARLFGPLMWLVCKLFGKRFIFRGFGGAYDLVYERMSPWGRWIFARTVLRADTVLMETQWLADYFAARGFNNVRQYANSRPLEAAGPLPSAAPHGAMRFVFLGRVTPSKGISEIIHAAAMLDRDVRVDVFGPLEDGLEETDVTAANVHWRGVLPPQEAAARLRQYDALILPTYYEGEGHPGAILEAFAAGVPVIASRWRAIPEIVDDTCGLLVEPQSAESLAEAMRTLADSPELLARLRAGAGQRAQQFAADRWTAEFVKIVRTLAGLSAPPNR